LSRRNSLSVEPAGLAQAEFAGPSPGRAPSRDFSFRCYFSPDTAARAETTADRYPYCKRSPGTGRCAPWPSTTPDPARRQCGRGTTTQTQLPAADAEAELPPTVFPALECGGDVVRHDRSPVRSGAGPGL